MKYILIIMMYYGNPAIATAEYDDQAACEVAREFVLKNQPRNLALFVACTPKASR